MRWRGRFFLVFLLSWVLITGSGVVSQSTPDVQDTVVGTRAETIVVNQAGGADHRSIQAALNTANDGDTVQVEGGIYYENPVVSNDIELIGAGSDICYIIGDSTDVLTIRSAGVLVKGFNITTNDSYSEGAGLAVDNVGSCSIEDNTITNKSVGLHLNRTTSIIIINNKMFSNGILISGTYLGNWDTHTIDSSNTVNGKMVHYWKNQTGGKVPDDAGQIILSRCNGVEVEDQIITDANVGLDIAFSTNIEVRNNKFDSNDPFGINVISSNGNIIEFNTCSVNQRAGISLRNCYGSIIENNTCDENGFGGIELWSSDGGTIKYNNVGRNLGYGMNFSSSDDNEIFNNTYFENNNYGISLDGESGDNTIHHNDFIANNEGAQGYDDGTGNNWNIPSGGNYWSEWVSPDNDSDGIVDLPYAIDGAANAEDQLPLTGIPVGGNPVLVANAGIDVAVDQHETLQFNGMNSWGTSAIINYTWSFNYDDEEITLYGGTVSFLFDTVGAYEIKLTITDEENRTDSDERSVYVLDIEPPIPDAGDLSVINRGETFIFDGSGSQDNAGITNYTWNFTYDGGQIMLNGATARFTFDIPGTYTITLNVTDARGNWAVIKKTLTVRDSDLPIARAGNDMIVQQGEIIFLNGTASFAVGESNYTWNFTYDGTEEILYGMVRGFSFNIPGVYVLTLNLTDERGNWNRDVVTVIVIDITAPVAISGTNFNISLGETAFFNATGSWDNVGIVNYTWEFQYNNTTVKLYGSKQSYLFDIPGFYAITLTVMDLEENRDDTELILTVLNANGSIPNNGSGNGTPPDGENGNGTGDDNETEEDSDGDGWNDTVELECGTDPYDPFSYPSDIDDDGIPDKLDPDMDGDGVPNEKDAYPRDPKRWKEEEPGYFLVALFFVLGLLLLILCIFYYTRLKSKNILNNKKRQTIVEFINRHPGEHYREIKRQLDMSSGTLRHHLKTLERSNMISSHREGKYLYYFPYGARKAGHILTPVQKEIVDIIQKEPGTTTQQIAEKLGKTRRAVQHHMNDLSDIGVLKVEKMGRAPTWHLDDDQSAGIPFGDRHRLVVGEKGKQISAVSRMKPTDSSVGDSWGGNRLT